MLLNTQPIEKRDFRADGLIDVHSVFETIQGEGPYCGNPCVFVRLAGCNLQCPLCDTEYTKGRQAISVLELILRIKDLRPSGLVVITGGEPFRQDLSYLLVKLLHAGYYFQIETNGTLPPSSFDYSHSAARRGGVIVCSPKSGKVNAEIWNNACCAKYVMDAGNVNWDDGLPITALNHSANPHVARPPHWWDRPIYLQPADEQDECRNAANIAAVKDSCMTHGYTMQLQIHKLIGVA